MKKNKEIALYYFSSTGNSLKLSLDISSHFPKSVIYKISTTPITSPPNATIIGFIFPVYMGGIPSIMEKFLQNFPFKKDVYYFSIGTYYTYKGCAMSIVNKILVNNGVSLSYYNYLPSVGNCLMKYEVSAAKRIKIVNKGTIYTSQIINDLKNNVLKRSPKHYYLLEIVHKSLFNVYFHKVHKKFTLENHCTSCSICQKVCPVNNISLKEGKPQWGTECEACHACVHWCPQNAINIGKSKGRLQYQNPAIKRAQLQ